MFFISCMACVQCDTYSVFQPYSGQLFKPFKTVMFLSFLEVSLDRPKILIFLLSLTGFHLSATVVSPQAGQSKGAYNVAVMFDRCRITSCSCTCGAGAKWCAHVVALCLFRIHNVRDFRCTYCHVVLSQSFFCGFYITLKGKLLKAQFTQKYILPLFTHP